MCQAPALSRMLLYDLPVIGRNFPSKQPHARINTNEFVLKHSDSPASTTLGRIFRRPVGASPISVYRPCFLSRRDPVYAVGLEPDIRTLATTACAHNFGVLL